MEIELEQIKDSLSSPSTIKIDIDYLPKMINALLRQNFWIIKKEKDLVYNHVFAKLAGKVPPKPFKKANLILTRYSSTCPDPDGLVSSFKFVVDAFVFYKVLENDRYDNIGMPQYSWRRCKRKEGKITIEIEESLE